MHTKIDATPEISKQPESTSLPSLTLALSGGGVAGLGHISVIAALDDLGIVPKAISGCSMGALMAACYAAGMSAADIEAHVRSMIDSPLSYTRKYLSRDWMGLLKASISPELVVDTITPPGLPETLADMKIPITVVATDFHRRECVSFNVENTRKALAASIAIPGVFSPLS